MVRTFGRGHIDLLEKWLVLLLLLHKLAVLSSFHLNKN